MDVVSHGLWGAALLGRGGRRVFFQAFALSLLPDLLSEGVMGVMAALGLPGMPDWSAGHPDLLQFPSSAQALYHATHSLLVFSAVFLLVWALRRRASWLLLAWGLHILIDIPTHSLALFPTPFLWPVSSLRVDGIPWHRAIIMVPNLLLLTTVYACWHLRRRAARIADR